MLLKEKYSDVFTQIKTKTDLLVFDFVEPSKLDNIYIFKYGDRQLNIKADETEKEVVINVLVSYFAKKWNDYFLTVSEGIEGMKNYTETVRETISDEGSVNFNRNSLNKVSAYNVDDFVDNTSDNDVETSETQNTKVREYEITKLKDVGAYEKIISYLNKNNIYDVMMLDINSILTTMILN